MANNETRRPPKYPDIFDSEYEDEIIREYLDGSEQLCKCVSFRGEREEVLEELKKIIANWPDGMYTEGEFDVSLGVCVQIKSPTKKIPNILPIKQIWEAEYPDILSKDGYLQKIDIYENGAKKLSDHTSGSGNSQETLEMLKKIIDNWPHGVCDNGKFKFTISMETMLNGKLPLDEIKNQTSV